MCQALNLALLTTGLTLGFLRYCLTLQTHIKTYFIFAYLLIYTVPKSSGNSVFGELYNDKNKKKKKKERQVEYKN